MIFIDVPVAVLASPAEARCYKFQNDCTASTSTPTRSYIVNTHRQKVGDIYNPGTGRLQIRNNHRQIIGYLERDGTITNSRRRPVAGRQTGN